MRFLPVFLDLQTGPVLLVGAGDLARAKLRLLAAAGARIRWFATDGHHDVARTGARRRGADRARRRRSVGGRSWRRDRDPLRGRRRHRNCDVGAGKGGRPARQCDGRPRRIRPSFFPPSSIAATWWWRSAPAALRRWWRAGCASASRRCCRRGSAISPLSSAAGASNSTAAFAELPLRRRFWERVVDGPIGALVLAGRSERPKRR